MAQNRDAPAYQEYAASVLALAKFKELTLAEKGLLYQLKMECWVNVTLPYDVKKLSRLLGCESSEITELLPQVMPFFSIEGGRIINPELEDYRTHLMAVREHRKKGAEITNAKKSKAKADAQARNERSLKSRSSDNCADAEMDARLVQSSTVKQSQNQLVGSGEHSAWINDYESESRGN